MIEFYLDSQSGISPYLQLVQQVRRAMLLGLLRDGDQLPTVKAVVASLTINPNTVSKAYRELEHEGLVMARTGVGTFVTQALDSKAVAPSGSLRRGLMRWLTSARGAGLTDDGIEALFSECIRATVASANVS